MHSHSTIDPGTIVPWATLWIRGRDALSFTQGQVAADVSQAAGWGALLTPASEVVAEFTFRTGENELALTLRAELAEAVVKQLRRFALRVQCTFELEGNAAGPYRTVGEQCDLGLAGPSEFALSLTPQSFGGTFVKRSISFTKGCFTGQELVGRLDARGSSVPFRLVHFTGPSSEAVDEFLLSSGPVGDKIPTGVTTCVGDTSGVRGLGFSHRSLLTDGEAMRDGIAIREV